MTEDQVAEMLGVSAREYGKAKRLANAQRAPGRDSTVARVVVTGVDAAKRG